MMRPTLCSNELRIEIKRIAIELRNQYVLGYYPKNQTRDGKYHKVVVDIAQPPGVPQIKAHWRQGYYAPSEN